MNEELTKNLCKEFPYLFLNRRRSLNLWDLFVTPSFGFECGDGWYNIIRQACICLMYEIKKNDKLWRFRPYICLFAESWNNLMFLQPYWFKRDTVFGKMARFTMHYTFLGFGFTQIKEKYGTLRLYMTYASEEMHQICSMGETLSEVTCEHCGDSGKLRGKGWMYTSCDEHAKPGDKDDETV